MTTSDLGPVALLVLMVGAALVGFAKTAVGGAGALAVVAFAAVLPARESTGALLPLLCVGDLVAVTLYRRHADWRLLVGLLPGVLPGLALGAVFLHIAGDDTVRRTIAAALMAMVVLQLWLRRRSSAPGADQDQSSPDVPAHRPTTLLVGIAAGFATMTANAAGAVTTLYMVMAGLPMLAFLGTAAWFYLIVNAAKVPLSAGLGLVSTETLALNALLLPALGLGAWLGVHLVRRIDQLQFERIVLLFTAVSSVALFL